MEILPILDTSIKKEKEDILNFYHPDNKEMYFI